MAERTWAAIVGRGSRSRMESTATLSADAARAELVADYAVNAARNSTPKKLLPAGVIGDVLPVHVEWLPATVHGAASWRPPCAHA